MINSQIFGLVHWLSMLEREQRIFAEGTVDFLPDHDRKRLDGLLNYGDTLVRQFELSGTENRIVRFRQAIRGTLVLRFSMTQELRTLHEALQDDLNFKYFYFYPTAKVGALLRVDADWAAVISAFPTAAPEIRAAVDLYASEHPTAAIFHLMRVTEIGLRALAHERGVSFPDKPMEWAEWGPIIDQIASKGKAAADALPKGPQRDAANTFYTHAVSQLRALKETRNRAMHYRGTFDDLDAQRALGRVQDLMNGLSEKIAEKTRKPITRWC